MSEQKHNHPCGVISYTLPTACPGIDGYAFWIHESHETKTPGEFTKRVPLTIFGLRLPIKRKVRFGWTRNRLEDGTIEYRIGQLPEGPG